MSENKRQQILIVDDERAIRMLVAEVLESDSRQVIAFESPVEALAYAEKHPFSVAILDLMMPIMTGLELASRLRTIQPNCFLIICTGYLAENYEGLSQAKQIDCVLQKPFNVMELINLCESAASR